MRRVSTTVVCVLLAAIVAGCGRTNPALIPQSNAQALSQTADRIQQACDAQQRNEAHAQVVLAQREVEELPTSVSTRLRSNLNQWIDQISDHIDADCVAAATATAAPTATNTPTSTPTPTNTPTPTPTQTETPTPTPSATATPTATATVPPTATPTVTDTPTAAPGDTR